MGPSLELIMHRKALAEDLTVVPLLVQLAEFCGSLLFEQSELPLREQFLVRWLALEISIFVFIVLLYDDLTILWVDGSRFCCCFVHSIGSSLSRRPLVAHSDV